MSRIGKLPITIPNEVTVNINESEVIVKGPKGELSLTLRPEISISHADDQLVLEITEDTKKSKALWGTMRALIANMIEGVSKGYEKKMELVGVGYRLSAEGKGITMALGYSHPVKFDPPEGITLTVSDNKTFAVSGIDKQLVGQTAAKIRSFRKPEVYKGKGVKYVDEVIKTKPGKAGKA